MEYSEAEFGKIEGCLVFFAELSYSQKSRNTVVETLWQGVFFVELVHGVQIATLACNSKSAQAACILAARKVASSTLQTFAKIRNVTARISLCPRCYKMNEGPRIGMCEEDESWRRTRKGNTEEEECCNKKE